MVSSIAPPRTYSEWVEIINTLKSGTDDEAVLQAMHKGELQWQSGIAERFTKKMFDAIVYRTNNATDRFQKDISRARGSENTIVQAILTLRKELNYLYRLVNIPALPDGERKEYRKIILEQADSMQKSLEDSAKGDRTGKLSRIVRNTRVNDFRE